MRLSLNALSLSGCLQSMELNGWYHREEHHGNDFSYVLNEQNDTSYAGELKIFIVKGTKQDVLMLVVVVVVVVSLLMENYSCCHCNITSCIVFFGVVHLSHVRAY